jgi:hypothetical protein
MAQKQEYYVLLLASCSTGRHIIQRNSFLLAELSVTTIVIAFTTEHADYRAINKDVFWPTQDLDTSIS